MLHDSPESPDSPEGPEGSEDLDSPEDLARDMPHACLVGLGS